MEHTNDYFDEGIACFEKCEYDLAVQCFIKAYNEGFRQEEIIQILYDCFIIPNESEFKKNYEDNREGFANMPYEDTVIDFIPVSDTKYYLYHTEKREFLGSFTLEEWKNRPTEVEFEGLIIGDVGDIRQVVETMRARMWSTIYFVLNEQKRSFFSFFKLPGFSNLYLENVLCLENIEEMALFFSTYSDFYMPKKVIAPNPQKYTDIWKEIHQKRIEDMDTPRENVYLSICIPSYNRGHIVLQSIQSILNSEYDSEIEIVISDNGSTNNTEGYQIISELQDSRVRYVRLDENQGYASNVYNVLSQAQGKFMVLCSDEDTMIVEELGNYLNYLKNHEDAGVIDSSGIGPNFMLLEEYVLLEKSKSIESAMNTNYLTGVAINGAVFREHNLLEEFQKMRGNVFLESYAHAVFAMMACKYGYYANCAIKLWNAWADAEDGEISGSAEDDVECAGEPPILSYMWPNVRIEQLNAGIEILEQMLDVKSERFLRIFFNRVWKTYYLVNIAYKTRKNRFKREYSWEEICKMIHDNDKILIEKYKVGAIEKALEELYKDWLQKTP